MQKKTSFILLGIIVVSCFHLNWASSVDTSSGSMHQENSHQSLKAAYKEKLVDSLIPFLDNPIPNKYDIIRILFNLNRDRTLQRLIDLSKDAEPEMFYLHFRLRIPHNQESENIRQILFNQLKEE